MKELTFNERFDKAEKQAFLVLNEIIGYMYWEAGRYITVPLPLNFGDKYKQDLDTRLKPIKDLKSDLKETYLPSYLQEAIDKVKSAHKFEDIPTPLHNRREMLKKFSDEHKHNEEYDENVIDFVLEHGSYDDFSKNIFLEMKNKIRKYDIYFLISHLC